MKFIEKNIFNKNDEPYANSNIHLIKIKIDYDTLSCLKVLIKVNQKKILTDY
jgi:hypothetical protein